jgi:hypothetical protein
MIGGARGRGCLHDHIPDATVSSTPASDRHRLLDGRGRGPRRRGLRDRGSGRADRQREESARGRGRAADGAGAGRRHGSRQRGHLHPGRHGRPLDPGRPPILRRRSGRDRPGCRGRRHRHGRPGWVCTDAAPRHDRGRRHEAVPAADASGAREILHRRLRRHARGSRGSLQGGSRAGGAARALARKRRTGVRDACGGLLDRSRSRAGRRGVRAGARPRASGLQHPRRAPTPSASRCTRPASSATR